jgi:hypothetical protein
MNEFLTVTDGTRKLKVGKGDAIRLELKLNKSPMGNKWVKVGDALFDFGSGKLDAAMSVTVTEEQYLYLEEMFHMLDYYRETIS